MPPGRTPGPTFDSGGSRPTLDALSRPTTVTVPQPASFVDQASGRLAQIGYAAVSLFSGEALPTQLMNTYFAKGRHANDGVFVVSEAQVDKLITGNPKLSEFIDLHKKLLVHALASALDERPSKAVAQPMNVWADDIVGRLRKKAIASGAFASEDVTTADYAPIVAGQRTRGEWVQMDPAQFTAFISFGGLRAHFVGNIVFSPASAAGPDSLTVRLSPALTDRFDFHLAQEDPGTGWLDHVLALLQRSGDTKPFSIEGQGSSFTLRIDRKQPPD